MSTKSQVPAITSKLIEVKSFQNMLFVEVKGEVVEVHEIDNPEDYDKATTLYNKVAAKGKNKGKMLYAVGLPHYIPKKKASNSQNIKAMKAQGLTNAQIVARLEA